MSTTERRTAVPMAAARSGPAPPRWRPAAPSLVALVVAGALACSPLVYGYYGVTVWAPLGLGAIVLAVMLVLGRVPRLGRPARLALAGIVLLVVLSFASILWAESRDSAWTGANQVAVYAVAFVIGLVAIRDRLTAWSVMVLLGLPALVSALLLAVEFTAGTGGGAFLASRLNAPMGYVNATAGLLMMGVWSWLGLAERLGSRWSSAAAMGVAGLIAGTAMLTQTRAVLLVAAASVVIVLLAAPGRVGRGWNLLIATAAVAASAHWTLAVYSSTAPTHLPTPSAATLRGAGLALLGAALLAFTLKLLTEHARSRLPAARRAHLGRRLGQLMLGLTIAALIAGAAVEHGRLATQWHDFTSLNDERSADNRFLALGGGPRDDLWRIAVIEFAGDPLGGVGAGNYADQLYRRRRQLEHVTTPHSLELQMLAELGVGGAVGLVLFVVPILAAGFTRSRRLLAGSDAALQVAALGAFTAWLAGTSVDWLYNIPGLTGMALLAAAVLVAPGAPPGAPGAPPGAPGRAAGRWRARRHYRALLSLSVAALALLAASLGRQYIAALYSDSGQALAETRPLLALRRLRSAQQFDPWSLQTQYAIAAAYARLNDYPAARAALLRAERLEPENFVPPALLGDIATRAGYRSVALAEYRRALRLDPREPALRRAVRAGERRRPRRAPTS